MAARIEASLAASAVHLVVSSTLKAQAANPAVLHPAIQATWATVIYPLGNGAGAAHPPTHVPSHAN